MKIRYFIITAFLWACAACNKDIAVMPVTFDVAVAKNNGTKTTVFSANDTARFNFVGNPDMITYFSGEAGKNYDFINRVSAAGKPQLQFKTVRANGAQPNSLSLLVSSDFKGVATKQTYGVMVRDTAATNANIAAAQWTDITARAALSTGATAAMPSGIIDLSDFLTQGKPVYIAFKYSAAAGSIQSKWTISALSLNNVLPDGAVYTIANLNAHTTSFANYGNVNYGPGWSVSSVPVDPSRSAIKYDWIYTDRTSLVITGAATAALAAVSAEAWAITGPIDLTRVMPDKGIAIKEISATLPSYSYNYTAAGVYTAVFVASNHTAGGTSTTVKKITLTINP